MRPPDIKTHIREYYAKLFEDNRNSRLPIKTGKDLAELLGYPVDSLPFITDEHWNKFLPCGNLLPRVRPRAYDRILNLGCGAAVDSFAIQAIYGDSIEIVNLDVVYNILYQTSYLHWISCGKFDHRLKWICGDGENLPMRSETVDWVLMNGSLNLFPEKYIVLGEIWRILKPSGFLVCADLCSATPLPDFFFEERDAWAWCMSGACTETELNEMLTSCGFKLASIETNDAEEMFYPVLFSCQKQAP